MKKKALFIVDVQHDFLPGGALAVPEGDEVIEVIRDLFFIGDHEVVVASRDWHPPDHRSFTTEPVFQDMSWPPHCVAGTQGAELARGISALHPFVIDKAFERDPEVYSGWQGRVNRSGGSVGQFMRERQITDVEVVGLATDYCVKATAIDSRLDGFPTTVNLQGTRPVQTLSGMQAVAEMAEHGIRFVY